MSEPKEDTIMIMAAIIVASAIDEQIAVRTAYSIADKVRLESDKRVVEKLDKEAKRRRGF